MKLAISNIAWSTEEEPAIAPRLRGWGADAIEVAPTRAFANPAAVSSSELCAYRDFWHHHGLPIVATQALLFGRPELELFATPSIRAQMLDYLSAMIDLSADLGAQALVFGSPKNRRVGALSRTEANPIAEKFFRQLGRKANARGVWFCLEANPAAYGCDFITSAHEALELVQRVDQPGFGLHLDAGGMLLDGQPEALDDLLADAGDWLRHYHISQPHLAPLDDQNASRHAAWLNALIAAGYTGYCSIEMRRPETTAVDTTVEHALHFLTSHATGCR